jgi:nucleolar MIF4G domain-containing protein 1
VRVLLECCLQERVWNPYYGFLALKLCQHSRAHRVTLQYCLWDHYKDLEVRMD